MSSIGESNEQLALRIKAGEDVADNMLKLWQQNQGMIEELAGKYCHMAEKEDLKQEAYFAICKAVDSYDPDKGSSFLTWAIFWIRQQMQRYCQNNGTVRMPVHVSEKIQQYRKLQNLFYLHVGRLPNIREYCYYLGCSEATLEKIRQSERASCIGSIDAPAAGSEDGSITVGDSIADPADHYEDMLDDIEDRQLKKILWGMVDDLPDCQGDVIRARYQENLTLKQTAERTGTTIDAARRWQQKALRELRKPSRANRLRPFYETSYIYNNALHGNGTAEFNRTWTSSTERVALRLV
ncbi:RNA polymerase sigma factor rpoD [uncultured Ruminococcus sp.]|nr:RNA polymerase sigma factor rpoD [uncultured Ruminococcus sp.]